jgi:antitoxin VapB
MTTVTSKTFKSGNSQAVRLPREIAFADDTEVTIERSGDVLTIRPKRMSIAEMLRRLDELPGPGEIEVRDPDIFPDREGL